jgi:hypothetical protein
MRPWRSCPWSLARQVTKPYIAGLSPINAKYNNSPNDIFSNRFFPAAGNIITVQPVHPVFDNSIFTFPIIIVISYPSAFTGVSVLRPGLQRSQPRIPARIRSRSSGVIFSQRSIIPRFHPLPPLPCL